MSRFATFVAVVSTALLSTPSAAYAADGASGSPLRIGLSLVGLVVAIYLLIEALSVKRIASGGVIAEPISYVVLAILCLAASALAQWLQNFVQGVTVETAQIASQVLVIAAMGLLAVYFLKVRTSLQRFLSSMTGDQVLGEECAQTAPGEGDDARG